MDYFAGLDVSVKETGVCIVDDTGGVATRESRGGGKRAMQVGLCARSTGRHWHQIAQHPSRLNRGSPDRTKVQDRGSARRDWRLRKTRLEWLDGIEGDLLGERGKLLALLGQRLQLISRMAS